MVYQPDRVPSAFERVEGTLAEGLQAARAALAIALPTEVHLALEPTAKILRDHVLVKRRLLSEQCRQDLGYGLDRARHWIAENGTTPELDAFVAGLSRALETSHLVAELLGAERDIGWHRGTGR